MIRSSSAADGDDARARQLLDAAFAVFMKNGFDKSSMSDVAAAAGVSRPTLYRSFATKEELFLGVVSRLHADAHAACRAAADGNGDLATRLAAIATAKLTAHIDVAQSSPHGADLLDLNQRIAGDLATAANHDFTKLVIDVMRGADGTEIDLAANELSPDRAAAIVVSVIDGLKQRIMFDKTASKRWKREVHAAMSVVVRGLREPIT
jgi:AcrR family transcriptional regulator